MKVLFYNVRGLGGGEKRAEVWKLVNEKQPTVLCIQESKWQVVTDVMIKNIWGDVPCHYCNTPFFQHKNFIIKIRVFNVNGMSHFFS